jgi:hypothetical protein
MATQAKPAHQPVMPTATKVIQRPITQFLRDRREEPSAKLTLEICSDARRSLMSIAHDYAAKNVN